MNNMIVVGNDIFDEFIKEDGYYVDKTELIYELAAKTRNKVTLFTRPRRFGKTLTMSMMESFFDIRRDSSDSKMVRWLYFWKYRSVLSVGCGQLSFRSIE